MKKKELDRIIALLGVMTLGIVPPAEAMVRQQQGLVYDTEIAEETIDTDMVFLSFKDRGFAVEEEGLRIKAEREEAERLRLIKEEEDRLRAIEEQRIAELNRKNNVSVELDNVLLLSYITVDELIAVFNFYDYSKNMVELAPIIVEAERTYGINAFIISAIASWESNYNKSTRAIYDNNVMGWGVYSSDSVGINATSKNENIMGACKFLKEAYLSPDGIYFNGYSTWSLNQKYCLDANGQPDDGWRIGVNQISKQYEWIYKYLLNEGRV